MTNKELIEEIRNRVVYVIDKHPANDWDEGWNMAQLTEKWWPR